MKMEPRIQADFSGGMNLFDGDTMLGVSEYALAYNVRNRDRALTAIQAPVEDTAAPAGPKQGLYAFDKYLLLFCNGRAYYKDIQGNASAWTQIADLLLSPTAPFIYVEAVPASTLQMGRKLLDAERADGTSAEPGLQLDPNIVISNSQAGLVVQDGVTQGWLILPDGTARRLQTYNEWNIANREYVPIMTRMKYVNGILFGLSAKDGRTIYRSVSGRPLDFVVNVTVAGEKGGDADTTSFNVGYEQVTCISSLNSGELLVATETTCHPVEFNFDRTIFAEPTFLNRKAFAVGIVNQFSFIERQGDYCAIDTDGIRSFNAVLTQQNEGRNSIFSLRLGKSLAGIKQSRTEACAIVYDNYSLFSLNTIYGPLTAVYDNQREQWVCFDDLDFTVKQFAVASQGSDPTLYAISTDKIYKLQKGASVLEASVTFGAHTSGKVASGIRLHDVYAAYDRGTAQGNVEVTLYGAGAEIDTLIQPMGHDSGVSEPVHINFQAKSPTCYKLQYRLAWQTNAALVAIETQLDENTRPTSVRQGAITYRS